MQNMNIHIALIFYKYINKLKRGNLKSVIASKQTAHRIRLSGTEINSQSIDTERLHSRAKLFSKGGHRLWDATSGHNLRSRRHTIKMWKRGVLATTHHPIVISVGETWFLGVDTVLAERTPVKITAMTRTALRTMSNRCSCSWIYYHDEWTELLIVGLYWGSVVSIVWIITQQHC